MQCVLSQERRRWRLDQRSSEEIKGFWDSRASAIRRWTETCLDCSTASQEPHCGFRHFAYQGTENTSTTYRKKLKPQVTDNIPRPLPSLRSTYPRPHLTRLYPPHSGVYFCMADQVDGSVVGTGEGG